MTTALRQVDLAIGVDADLGDELAAGVHGPCPADLAGFEQAFMAVVEAAHVDRDTAWDAFYDATLRRVGRDWGRDVPGSGTVAGFTRIWTRAAGLSRGSSALDIGTCFGFLPLAWSQRPAAPRLLAVDLSRESAALAARQARRLGGAVGVVCADGARLPLPDRSVSTVHLLHVLEHLPPALANAVLGEALRVADRRVVVAVPVESRPDPLYGHVQAFDLASLAALGRQTAWHAETTAADGAWLVLDRPVSPSSATSGAGRAALSGRRPRPGASRRASP